MNPTNHSRVAAHIPHGCKNGLTLIEVMVAVSILTIAGLGTISGLLQARKATEGSIYLATATTISQGYLEQVKNMDFNLLDEPVIEELINQGNSDTLTVSPFPSDPLSGDPTTDIANLRLIDINNTPQNAGDDLPINYYLYIEDITDEANGVAEARRIVLRYEYTDTSTAAKVKVSNSIVSIRSNVPTF